MIVICTIFEDMNIKWLNAKIVVHSLLFKLIVEQLLISNLLSIIKLPASQTFKISLNKLLIAATKGAFFLNWLTLNSTIRTKHTTITFLWFQQFPAINALLKKLTGISWHYLFFLKSTYRTGEFWFKNYFVTHFFIIE